MDTLSPNNGSAGNSSGSSATSSSMDLKSSKKMQRQRDQKLSRSRSFLHLLSKHLGRHFQNHHHHNDTIYSSQDDIRSSSTDSFSLSGSQVECHQMNGCSSLDLGSGGEERTSRASSASAYSRYSPVLDYYDGYRCNPTHIYVETVYRPTSAMAIPNELDRNATAADDMSDGASSIEADDDNDDGQNVEHENEVDENENTENMKATNNNNTRGTPRNHCKGLHLSRISISSSVSRVLHHFSVSSASMRSLSCSSTPLRQLKAKSASMSATVSSTTSTSMSTTKSTKSKSLTPRHSSSRGGATKSSANGGASSSTSAAKKEKKQQSILRPPVQYVYMKGMSGLYSRVPSYAVCCPYTMHQMY